MAGKNEGLGAGCIVFFAFACVIVLVAGGIMGIVESRQNKKLPGVAELEKRLDEYARVGTNALAVSSDPASETVVGMVVPIDVSDADSPRLDFDILKLLPKGNRPLSDADVQTVALTRYFEKGFPGFYEDGGTGYADACEITVVDRASGKLISHGVVLGTPPAVIVDGQHSAGALQDGEVLAFILGQTEQAE